MTAPRQLTPEEVYSRRIDEALEQLRDVAEAVADDRIPTDVQIAVTHKLVDVKCALLGVPA